MNPLLRHRFFWLSAAFSAAHQLMIGWSTYCIGLAGGAVSTSQQSALSYITVFFASVALAYILGTVASIFQTRLSNDLWHQYCKKVFSNLGGESGGTTEVNKSSTHWIAVESLQTFNEASAAIMETVSVCLNVSITLVVFALVLGMKISVAISLSLLSSILSVLGAKKYMERLSTKIQRSRLKSVNSIGRIWNNLCFEDGEYAGNARHTADQKTDAFFSDIMKHKVFATLVSCAPVLIAIPLIIITVHKEVSKNPLLMGPLVAMLPRSLHVLQNIHSACVCIGHMIFLENKLYNLNQFFKTPPKQDLDPKINHQRLKSHCVKETVIDKFNSGIIP